LITDMQAGSRSSVTGREAPARGGIDGQVHADTEQLALLADAAHVLALGEA